jgi:hypothetical protein
LAAAKQAAFEEQNKIKNQFRALDDDEIDFLDEVRQKKRQEEELVKRETEQGLRAFRDAQKERGETEAGAKEGERGLLEEKQKDGQEENWGVGRKRKRARERERDVKGVRRKASEEEGKDDTKPADMEKKKKPTAKSEDHQIETGRLQETGGVARPAAAPQAKPAALGLVDYDSDTDD